MQGGVLHAAECCARDNASSGFCAHGPNSRLTTGPGCVSVNNKTGFKAAAGAELLAGPQNTATACAENGFEACGMSLLTTAYHCVAERNGANGFSAHGGARIQVRH